MLDLVARQLMEDDDFVDAVEKLRPESLLDFFEHFVLHPLVALIFVFRGALLRAEADVGRRRHARGADVGRHNDDAVFEIDLTPLGVGQAPVVEHLQQQVEDVGVRLFDFVEQHDGVRPAAHGFG